MQWRDDSPDRQQLSQPLQQLLRLVVPLMGSIAEVHQEEEADADVGLPPLSPAAAAASADGANGLTGRHMACWLQLLAMPHGWCCLQQQLVQEQLAGAAVAGAGSVDVELVLSCASACWPDGCAGPAVAGGCAGACVQARKHWNRQREAAAPAAPPAAPAAAAAGARTAPAPAPAPAVVVAREREFLARTAKKGAAATAATAAAAAAAAASASGRPVQQDQSGRQAGELPPAPHTPLQPPPLDPVNAAAVLQQQLAGQPFLQPVYVRNPLSPLRLLCTFPGPLETLNLCKAVVYTITAQGLVNKTTMKQFLLTRFEYSREWKELFHVVGVTGVALQGEARFDLWCKQQVAQKAAQQTALAPGQQQAALLAQQQAATASASGRPVQQDQSGRQAEVLPTISAAPAPAPAPSHTPVQPPPLDPVHAACYAAAMKLPQQQLTGQPFLHLAYVRNPLSPLHLLCTFRGPLETLNMCRSVVYTITAQGLANKTTMGQFLLAYRWWKGSYFGWKELFHVVGVTGVALQGESRLGLWCKQQAAQQAPQQEAQQTALAQQQQQAPQQEAQQTALAQQQQQAAQLSMSRLQLLVAQQRALLASLGQQM